MNQLATFTAGAAAGAAITAAAHAAHRWASTRGGRVEVYGDPDVIAGHWPPPDTLHDMRLELYDIGCDWDAVEAATPVQVVREIRRRHGGTLPGWVVS